MNEEYLTKEEWKDAIVLLQAEFMTNDEVVALIRQMDYAPRVFQWFAIGIVALAILISYSLHFAQKSKHARKNGELRQAVETGNKSIHQLEEEILLMRHDLSYIKQYIEDLKKKE